MNTPKQLSSVALFPLCDARGILIDALRSTRDGPATRGDALVFAWRLELPDSMNVGHAANAVLVSALSVPRSSWTRRQLLIIRELMVLAGREEPLPGDTPQKTSREALADSIRSRRTPKISRQAPGTAMKSAQVERRSKAPKQDKDWWKLVGRDDKAPNNGQRKTRSGRVSREP